VNAVGKDVAVSTCTKGSRGGAFVVAELYLTLAGGRKTTCDGGGSMQVIDEELEEEREKARKLVKEWFDAGVRKDV
jgi:pumilio family protein 6